MVKSQVDLPRQDVCQVFGGWDADEPGWRGERGTRVDRAVWVLDELERSDYGPDGRLGGSCAEGGFRERGG